MSVHLGFWESVDAIFLVIQGQGHTLGQYYRSCQSPESEDMPYLSIYLSLTKKKL